MILHKILMLVLLGTGYYTRVRDGYHVHELYRNRDGKVTGGYQQNSKNNGFAAQCVNGPAVAQWSEKDARRFVETCPDRAQPAAAPQQPSSPTFTIDLGFVSADGPIKGFSK